MTVIHIMVRDDNITTKTDEDSLTDKSQVKQRKENIYVIFAALSLSLNNNLMTKDKGQSLLLLLEVSEL